MAVDLGVRPGASGDTRIVPSLTFQPRGPLDLVRTLAPLRHGPYDPTIHLAHSDLWRAMRTPMGPVTLHLHHDGHRVTADAWGPGADWQLEAVPDLLGENDDPTALRPAHPLIARLARQLVGVRLPRTRRMVEALIPAVLEQKVSGVEAQRVYGRLVRTFGELGPHGDGGPELYVSPDPERLASLPYFAFHPLGLERRRAEVLRRIGVHAAALEAAVALSGPAARAQLMRLPGIGPWTAAEATRLAMGDPDAVSLGDYHLPALVSWALAGEHRADDDRMLEVLAPYEGQRARVVRLLELGATGPPRRGPRLPARSIEGL
jgi:3-methyladenine DNA glycosylase/8-oxoguanine DNA glycosylase